LSFQEKNNVGFILYIVICLPSFVGVELCYKFLGMQHMEVEDEAKSAIAALDGYSVNGSHIHVEVGLCSLFTDCVVALSAESG